MFPNIETIPLLPKEIEVFKNYIIEQEDPIRRKVFSYSLVSFVVKNIVPFPVNIEYYYEIKPKDNNVEEFMEFLVLSYIRRKLYLISYNLKDIFIKSEDMFYSSNFIMTFFDFETPIRDNDQTEIVWIYPKKSIRNFISNNFFNKNHNNYFYDEMVLIKLIMIMAGFSRYELNNLDNCTNEEIKQINYPTLILANIGLYEKNLIKIRDDINGISVFLDLKAKGEKEQLFSKDKEFLKETILKVINKTEDVSYTIKDFL